MTAMRNVWSWDRTDECLADGRESRFPSRSTSSRPPTLGTPTPVRDTGIPKQLRQDVDQRLHGDVVDPVRDVQGKLIADLQ